MDTTTNQIITCLSLVLLGTGCSPSVDEPASNNIDDYAGTASITQGAAQTMTANIFDCENAQSRVVGVGEITDSEGGVWTVPGNNNFMMAAKAADLYEECQTMMPSNLSRVDQAAVPVVIIDPDGDEITGYIFADNYFELYINGTLVAVDSVPFTPFNSSIVKFKVNKPYTIAVKVIDWEENLGLGTEDNQGKRYHPGDGGFIASFSDGTITSSDWQAQTFYTAPIYNLACLKEVSGRRMSETCSTDGTDYGEHAYAAHWKIPTHWMNTNFDSVTWPQASLFTDDEVGVNNKKAYMNFIEKFSGAGASFIWSTNLVLDNEVLFRYEVK